MSIEIVWDNENRDVIRFTFADMWTWENYYRTADQARQWIESAPHAVDIIFEMQSDYIPSGVLQQGLRLNTALPRDVTTIAIIGANRLYKTFGRVLGRLFPTVAGMYVYCDNLQEARSQIVHRRTQSVYYES